MSAVPRDVACDVGVLGGGAAGLAGAVALARSLRSVVVVDAGQPRNAPADHAHNVLGREGTAPRDLLAAGRREAEGYGVRFLDDRAVLARRDDAGFVVELLGGAVVRARRLLLATGLLDELPDVPGVRESWGRSVLHCPFCHGWEVRGQHVGVLGSRPSALHQALLFRQLTPRVTLFVQDLTVPAETAEQFRALGITVRTGTVRRVGGADGDLRVEVGSEVGSEEVAVHALVVTPFFRARAEVFAQLGGQLAQNAMGEFVPTSTGGATDVPGVWAAGNVADPGAMVAASTGAGVLAGAAINGDLVLADARAAVETARAAR
ncbi:NAD(P)/FAD-dependent oxidoreductase [Kineococcus rhizosphaerae]|uniref:Thioredoxin reductase n=1 Tax=Kineococcus rhizosphaerae TaxID=559628 RepID=A0A2T0R5M5_9ACTN|nr:NAD(P)/FAD-dependent oxidoreductase [Kineococcus rhizosphaerae]PRY16066.1 thioredoxin reductase [Kineococcus rhizosphaerae]